MKIVLVPDSFKESMTAKEACMAMERGIKKVINSVEIINVPMGDGAEGTLDALVDATNGEIFYKDIVASLGNKVKARFGILGDKKTDIIEIAYDVKNTLTGPEGASEVFGRQKGASDADVKVLDENLKQFVDISKKIIGKDIDNIQGAGAAGGLGAALIGFCNAEVKRGIDTVIEYSNLEDKLKDADLVLTGEGSIDFQTKFGKTLIGVATLAKKYDIPVIVFGGRIGNGIEELYSLGIDFIIGITPCVIGLD